jgi:glutathione S-transferase
VQAVRQLYHFPLCPFSRKVRLHLREKQLEVELIDERPWMRREEFMVLNPAVEVPVMIETDGTVLVDSNVICEWIAETYSDEPNYLGSTRRMRAEVRRLVQWFDIKFNREVTRNLLYEKYFKKQAELGGPASDAIRAGKINITHHLDYIGFLLQSRNWLAGDQLSLADFAAAAHLSALDYFGDVPWEHNRTAKVCVDQVATVVSAPA